MSNAPFVFADGEGKRNPDAVYVRVTRIHVKHQPRRLIGENHLVAATRPRRVQPVRARPIRQRHIALAVDEGRVCRLHAEYANTNTPAMRNNFLMAGQIARPPRRIQGEMAPPNASVVL